MKRFQALAAMALALALASPLAASAADPVAVERAVQQDAKCTRCHDESESRPILAIYQTRHGVRGDDRSPTCQSCHGESERHLKGDPSQKGRAAPDVVFGHGNGAPHASAARDQNAACLNCHRNGQRQHWAGSAHEARDLPCSTCHGVHAARDPVLARVTQPEVCFRCHKEQRAQVHRISAHPIDAGKMACSDCHNPHGSTAARLLVKNTVNDLCLSCHTEKRGPFLWEHQPVSEECTNCHTPHGSTNTPLLKARLPWLCQECHSGDHARSVYSGANLAGGAVTSVAGMKPFQAQGPNAQIVGRDCLNCHSLVHGSNSPAGAKFQR